LGRREAPPSEISVHPCHPWFESGSGVWEIGVGDVKKRLKAEVKVEKGNIEHSTFNVELRRKKQLARMLPTVRE